VTLPSTVLRVLKGDVCSILGAPLPLALFMLPLVLLTASLFGVAGVCRRHGAAFPITSGMISQPHQERAS
jgi:hypothetical protein